MPGLFYSPTYVVSAHAFDTTRKARWIADSLATAPIPGVELTAPTATVTETQLADVHAPDYVAAVRTGEPRTLAESQGFPWDPNVWTMALATTSGIVSAALAALTDGVAGTLSSGYHHARREMGDGFCTFNGLVVAARAALDAGASSVLILDLDAHCGGGTASLIEDEPRIRQLDVSVCAYDRYRPSERSTLDIVGRASEYLPTIRRRLDALASGGDAPGLCIYNAGMDPFERCDIGGLKGITSEILAEREALVFRWFRERGVPIAFTPAGGYTGRSLDQAGLVALHRATIAAAATPPIS